jgi:hypothetical protein
MVLISIMAVGKVLLQAQSRWDRWTNYGKQHQATILLYTYASLLSTLRVWMIFTA